jgi:Ni/Co efflux regulator RcnB
MKPVFSAAIALAMAAGVAQAQPTDNQDHRDHRGQTAAPARPQAAPVQGAARTGPRGGWTGATGATHSQAIPQIVPRGGATVSGQTYRGQGQTTYRGQSQGAYRGQGQTTYRGQSQGTFTGATARGGVQSGRQATLQSGSRGGVRGQRSLRPQDQGRSQFDPNRFRHSYFAQRRYNAGAYYQPRGWYYRRWGFGDILPFGWFASNYYLSAFDYGLPPPPIGAEWVRNGPDAVLVDIWSGEVLSVEYGVFY